MYEWSPYVPYSFMGALMIALFLFMWLSPTLRNAGVIKTDLEAVEETAETPVANA